MIKGPQMISDFVAILFISQIFKLCSEKHTFPSSKFTKTILGTGKNKIRE